MDDICCWECGAPCEECDDDEELLECQQCGQHYQLLEYYQNKRACAALLKVDALT